jgi:uncharacterized membrane protein YkvA (DUF1232 family)
MPFLEQINQLLETLRYIWRDSRVPMLARIFVVLAPLYWLNPYDVIPDLQPGGYYDDLALLGLLIVLAFRLVPKAVFRDAREAARLGKKAAVFGVLYVTLTGIIPCQIHTRQFSKKSAYRWQQQFSLDCSASPQKKKQLTEASAKDRFDRSKLFRFIGFSDNQYSASSHNPGESQSAVSTMRDLTASRHRLPVFLITRGGQRQLYASEDGAVSRLLAAKPLCPLKMPPCLAGGIFAALTATKSPPSGEGPC